MDELLEDYAARIAQGSFVIQGVEARRPWLLHDRPD